MRCFTFLWILFSALKCLAQPQISFDTTEYVYPNLVEGREAFRKNVWFTNTGNEPLIIHRAGTGDGGSYAEFPREPIMPGKKGKLIFVYDLQRIGPFTKTMYVESNDMNNHQITIKFKGEVLHKRTEVKVDFNKISVGSIEYGNMDTIRIKVRNVGKENMYISPLFSTYNYPEADVFYYRILDSSKNQNVINYNYADFFKPDQEAILEIVIRNVYGNVGEFTRSFPFRYNSHDTLIVFVYGRYIGGPDKSLVIEERSFLTYENNKLIKKLIYNEGGVLQREDVFSGAYCSSSKRYNQYPRNEIKELIYDHGEEVETKLYPPEK